MQGDSQPVWLESPGKSMVDSLLACGMIMPNSVVAEHEEDRNLHANVKTAPKRRVTATPASKPATSKKLTRKNSNTVLVRNQPGTSHAKSRTANLSPLISRRCVTDFDALFSIPNTSHAKTRSVSRDEDRIDPSTFARSPPTEKVVPSVTIEQLLSTKKRFSAKHEAVCLAREYRERMNMLNEALTKADYEGDIITQQMNLNFLTWNSLIGDMRSFSEQHAALMIDIKNFFREKLGAFPELIEKAEAKVRNAQNEMKVQTEKMNELKNELESKQKEVKDLNSQISALYIKLDYMKTEKSEMNDRYNNTIYEKETVEGELGHIQFRYQKIVEQKTQIEDQLKTTENIAETYKTQIKQQEELIKKYEEEGAGFRPLYLKSCTDLKNAVDEIESLKEKIKEMVPRQITTEAGVQTMPVKIVEMKNKDSKKNAKKVAKGQPMTKKASMSPMSEETKPKSEQKKPRGSQKLVRADSSTCSTDDIVPPQDSPTPIVVSPEVSPREVEYVPEPEEETLVTQSEPVIPQEEPLTSVRSLTSSRRKSTSLSLPADYTIGTEFTVHAPSLINCVYRLLPLPHDANEEPSKLIDSVMAKQSGRIKPYGWVLQKILDFFRSTLNMDQLSSITIDSTMMLQNVLMNSCGIDSIAERIMLDMIQAAHVYKDSSQCVEFFMKFVLMEWSTVEYKFFNILFNITFEYLYPSITTILEDPDISPSSVQFLIHIEICKKVISLLFTHIDPEEFDFTEIREKTRLTVHPSLISFWAFAEALIKQFRATHVQFHKQVKTIVTLIGWGNGTAITEELFHDFFVLVKPSMSDDDISKYYKRFILETSIKKEKQNNRATFIRFCSDFPEIANEILKLKYDRGFEHTYHSLHGTMHDGMNFLKNRFTKFARKVRQMLTKDLQEKTEALCNNIRNALLRCDVSSALTHYRRLLQYIDLKLTEANPFIVISSNVSMEYMQQIINSIRVREKTMAQHFSNLAPPEQPQPNSK